MSYRALDLSAETYVVEQMKRAVCGIVPDLRLALREAAAVSQVLQACVFLTFAWHAPLDFTHTRSVWLALDPCLAYLISACMSLSLD